MKSKNKIAVWVIAIAVAVAVVATIAVIQIHRAAARTITLKGAVLIRDSDPRKRLPIADVLIDPFVAVPASDKASTRVTNSDASGFFWLKLPRAIRRGQEIVLRFRHPGYQPLDATIKAGDELFIVQMVAIPHQSRPTSDHPETTVSNVRVRYTIKTYTTVDVGSVVKTFEVQNSGNIPCQGRPPCSPDGKWKASIGAASFDAGEGNEFRNARVSCMAGPCPFTKIEADGFSRGGRTITVAVRDWSDPATFLVEAEVVHPTVSDLVRDSYPLVFGQAFNFSLAGSAEGPSIEAEIGGEAIIFPLGPSLCLSWSDCTVSVGRDQTKAYRCELKPGYRFP
jgi:hypothetical protein